MKYSELVELYCKVEATSKRLEKTYFISQFLKNVDIDDLNKITLLLQGKVFPSYAEQKIGVAAKMVVKAISKSTGIEQKKIESEWKKTGDLGITAENLVKQKKQATLFSTALGVSKVFNNLKKLPELEGRGAVDRKIALISELLTSASPIEAKYIVRTILEDLRVGIAEGTLRDGVVWSFFDKSIKINYDDETKAISPENRELYNIYIETVQEAYDILNDFGDVAEIAKISGLTGLRAVKLKIGKPVKVMLYPKAKDIKDAFERVGRPAAIEFKYDGFRMQIHKKNNKIIIFTRRLEDVTKQFPEVVQYTQQFVNGDYFVLDCEAVGFDPKSKKYLPFQIISQRIKRKYDIDKMSEKFPVEVNVFDILCYNNENLIKIPYDERRKIIKRIISDQKYKIVTAKQIITDDDKKADDFYKEALAAGEEGVMFKKLDGIYRPGSRVGYGVKVKPVMESLDLVIVGAEWGEGKRSGWLTSFTLACIDEETGEFLEIGKVGTGIKELESEEVTFQQMTDLLKPLIIDDIGREVKVSPQIVVEINYEEIQKSPTYSSGYALRFPRVVRIREDKPIEEIASVNLVEEFYSGQRAR